MGVRHADQDYMYSAGCHDYIWVESVIRPFLGRKKAFLPEAAAAFGYLFIYLQTLSE